ncbi:hypothetical protein [Pseudomonas chlororaphis]|uniref:hypothetical protein n=1 Tax=Pseudomonas chlororaphis TaxID=587753 RepID=UPI00236532F9|nr:hypothetical protein [Pseudomonas chlororaphis]WDH19985.1 hypothetical protein PUP50_18305 [Pseudomonas chlororaphis]
MLDILIEVIFRAICFPIGWPIVKLFTLGKHPSKNSLFTYTPESEWTSAAGLAILVIAIMAAMKQFIFL